MKKILLVTVVGGILVSGIAYFLLKEVLFFSWREKKQISVHTLVLKKVEDIGSLELVRFNFNDVVEESVKREFLNFDRLAPDSRVILMVNGEAAACIDLKKINSSDITISGDEIFINLPLPVICYSKVNHSKSKIYDVNLTARALNPELIDKGFKNAERKIEEEAINLGILELAKENAVKLLTPLFEELTEKKVIVGFKEETLLQDE